MHSDPSRMLTTQGNATNWSHLWLQIASDLKTSSYFVVLSQNKKNNWTTTVCKVQSSERQTLWNFHLRNIWAAPASPTVETGHFFGVLPMICSSTFGSMKVSYGSHTHHQEKNKAQLAAFVVHLKNPKKPPGKNQGSSIKMTQIYYNIIEKPENLPVCLTPSPCHCLMLNETQGVIRLDLEGYQDSRSLSPLMVGI